MAKGWVFIAPIHVEVGVEDGEDVLLFLLACGHTTTRSRALWPHWKPDDVLFQPGDCAARLASKSEERPMLEKETMMQCSIHDLNYDPDEDCCPWCLADYEATGEPDGCYHCGSPLHHASDCRETDPHWEPYGHPRGENKWDQKSGQTLGRL